MGAQAWTRVTIGGSITEEKFYELLELVDNDFYEHGTDIDAERKERVLEAKDGKFSQFEFEGMVSWGEPDDLLGFCKDHDLAYVHSYDTASGGDFEPGINAWRPGWEKDQSSDANSSGDPVVSLAELMGAKVEGKTLEDLIASKSVFSVVHIPPLTITFDAEEKANAEASQ